MFHIYDSRTRAVRAFIPVQPGKVSIYLCGPTVQSAPHIGHLRSALTYDLLNRWLTHRGYTVTLVRNVTDIDDKVLALATEDEPWWARAYRVETEFTRLYASMRILAPTYEPRTSGHIIDTQAFIERLIQRGHAYAASDASGDVYFDVSSWGDYGALTRQKPDSIPDSDEAPSAAKRDARDFALWKGTKPNEPASASWPSPWGAGRPGWHIQCSAMSHRYLGPVFDIHGGGLDLRFPRHENELAQSAAAGDAFARNWVHNGLVTVGGQKMAKSLSNWVSADELLQTVGPDSLRYYLLSAHYRSTLDYHPHALADAQAAFARVLTFLKRHQQQAVAAAHTVDALPRQFADALDDDLNVPAALAVLHEHVRTGNMALDRGERAIASAEYRAVSAMLTALGMHLDDKTRPTKHDNRDTLADLLDVLVARREQARAAGDYASADRIRDDLARAGIVLEDTPSTSTWRTMTTPP